jgi:hypothetical protein
VRILALDVETRPALAYVWRAYDENISPEQVVDPGGVMCFAAKWIGEKGVEFYSDFHDGHEVMVSHLHALLDEADVVLHFNGRRFDIPHINREVMQAGLLPPAPFKQIDLLETVKHQFRFLMNRLAFVAPQLGLDGKVEHEGFGLWKKCMDGDEKAWKRMRKYNIRDVTLLEDAYAILRPWVRSHPSHGAHSAEDVCPKCGGDVFEARGYAVTTTGRYHRFHCLHCGAWFRATQREKDDRTKFVQVAD